MHHYNLNIFCIRGHPLSTYANFFEKLIFLTPDTRNAYQGVRNICYEMAVYVMLSFTENFTIFGSNVEKTEYLHKVVYR